MIPKKWLGRSLILFVNMLITLVATLSGFQVQSAFASPNTAMKGQAVAIVYYRCEVVKGECTPRGGTYFVHNGKALADLPLAADHSVLISHVSTWPTIEHLHICGTKEAAMHLTPGKGNPCHGSKGTGADTIWRPWVWVRIRPYGGIPIAFEVNGDTAHPHNGSFYCFAPAGKSCDTKLPTGSGVVISGTGILYYWHYVNPTSEKGRTATDPGAFILLFAHQPPSGTAMIKVKRL